jgi:Ca2+-binding EF-hand superfamily protein
VDKFERYRMKGNGRTGGNGNGGDDMSSTALVVRARPLVAELKRTLNVASSAIAHAKLPLLREAARRMNRLKYTGPETREVASAAQLLEQILGHLSRAIDSAEQPYIAAVLQFAKTELIELPAEQAAGLARLLPPMIEPHSLRRLRCAMVARQAKAAMRAAAAKDSSPAAVATAKQAEAALMSISLSIKSNKYLQRVMLDATSVDAPSHTEGCAQAVTDAKAVHALMGSYKGFAERLIPQAQHYPFMSFPNWLQTAAATPGEEEAVAEEELSTADANNAQTGFGTPSDMTSRTGGAVNGRLTFTSPGSVMSSPSDSPVGHRCLPTLSYFEQPLFQPLTSNLSAELAVLAVRASEGVLAATGEWSFQHCGIVCRDMLLSVVGRPALHDEVILQLASQLTNSPTDEKRDRGWRLLEVSLSLFAPSDALEVAMEGFLHAHQRSDLIFLMHSTMVKDAVGRTKAKLASSGAVVERTVPVPDERWLQSFLDGSAYVALVDRKEMSAITGTLASDWTKEGCTYGCDHTARVVLWLSYLGSTVTNRSAIEQLQQRQRKRSTMLARRRELSQIDLHETGDDSMTEPEAWQEDSQDMQMEDDESEMSESSEDEEPGLPEGWAEVVSEDGAIYWYNETDGSTTWVRPVSAEAVAEAEAEVADVFDNSLYDSALDTSVAALPQGWVEVVSEDGTIYWYNEADGSTTWTRPEAEAAAVTPTSDAAVASPTSEDAHGLMQKQLLEVMDRLSMRPIDLFNAFDQDHDNSISVDEFATGLQKISVESRGRNTGSLVKRLSITDIQSLVQLVDADGDGIIDMKEWRSYMKETFREISRRPSQRQLAEQRRVSQRRQSHLVQRRESELRRRDSKGVTLPPGWKEQSINGAITYKHSINGVVQTERPTADMLLSAADGGSRKQTATNILLPVVEDEEELPEMMGEAMNKLAEGMRRISMRPLDMFRALDVDKGGTISCEELTVGLRRLGIIGLDDDDMKDLFLIFDSDGGGDISVSEWKEHHKNWNRAKMKKEQRRKQKERQDNRSSPPLLTRDMSVNSVASDQASDYEYTTSEIAAGAGDINALPEGWTEATDETGQVYFYNSADGSTSWERPTEDYQREEGWTQDGVDIIQPAEYEVQ